MESLPPRITLSWSCLVQLHVRYWAMWASAHLEPSMPYVCKVLKTVYHVHHYRAEL